jgi:uncharacterized protein YcnI
MKKIIASLVTALTMVAAVPGVAFAHVVVTPGQAGIGDRVLFTVSVPNEKTVAVSSIKLTIPRGLQDVQPDVTAGWSIATDTNKNNDVTSITWTGAIPAGQRADLAFKAQTPAQASKLYWKAYQTYVDGTVVSWSQQPNSTAKRTQADDSNNTGPYSVTEVVDDVSTSAPTDTKASLAFVFSIAALALSVSGLFWRRK